MKAAEPRLYSVKFMRGKIVSRSDAMNRHVFARLRPRKRLRAAAFATAHESRPLLWPPVASPPPPHLQTARDPCSGICQL
jgi:hypothetical protein